MPLSQLQITHVRNLQQVRLSGLSGFNLFYGENGSGKTSILEAISILGMARSFRTGRPQTLITHGQTCCTVFGQLKPSEEAGDKAFGSISLGVERERNSPARIRINGNAVNAVSELAVHLPLQVLNAQSFDLLLGGPAARRKYLDWGLFHVEQGFFPIWQTFQRCIKQRNSLLRRGKIDNQELKVWTDHLAEAGEALDTARQAYRKQLLPVLEATLARLAPDLTGLEFRFRRGWDKQLTYAEALTAGLPADQEHGFTHVGPQRADLRIVIEGASVADVLSRGQLKLVVCALKLAQGELLARMTGESCTYLVDDLPSELDGDRIELVMGQLKRLGGQVFITAIDRASVEGRWSTGLENLAVFHVEHGNVHSVSG